MPAFITISSSARRPALALSTSQDYRQVIDDLCKFLEGRTDPVVKRLNETMEKAAEDLQYEKAAVIRDQLQAIDKVVERQKVISSDQTDSDVIAMAREEWRSLRAGLLHPQR